MLSPVLLEEVRAHWRRLRKKSVWLFPGNRWHSGDHPTDDKTPYHAFPSPYCGACFVASSSPLLGPLSNAANCTCLESSRRSLIPKFFAALLRPLFRKDWIVYSKPPFGGPEYVLQYLGRYTHRVATSNHRLVAFGGRPVYLSLAGLCRPQSAESDDHLAP